MICDSALSVLSTHACLINSTKRPRVDRTKSKEHRTKYYRPVQEGDSSRRSCFEHPPAVSEDKGQYSMSRGRQRGDR